MEQGEHPIKPQLINKILHRSEYEANLRLFNHVNAIRGLPDDDPNVIFLNEIVGDAWKAPKTTYSKGPSY